MRVYAAQLICSTAVLGFQTFKLTLCIYHKLYSHDEILKAHIRPKVIAHRD